VETIGWRYGFHLGTICGALFTAVAVWSLPVDEHEKLGNVWRRLRTEIDWIGALIASSCLAMLFYVFA
jgi:predicted MFS family arabinose efflux permease